MSTPAMVIVRQNTYTDENNYKTDELYRFYCHWDGYPEGLGVDLAKACVEAEKAGVSEPDGHGYRSPYGCLNNRNWCQWFTKYLFDSDSDYEIMPAGMNYWVDYVYIVEGDYIEYGGKQAIDNMPVTIAVYYEDALEEPIFKGTAAEFIDRFAG